MPGTDNTNLRRYRLLGFEVAPIRWTGNGVS